MIDFILRENLFLFNVRIFDLNLCILHDSLNKKDASSILNPCLQSYSIRNKYTVSLTKIRNYRDI